MVEMLLIVVAAGLFWSQNQKLKLVRNRLDMLEERLALEAESLGRKIEALERDAPARRTVPIVSSRPAIAVSEPTPEAAPPPVVEKPVTAIDHMTPPALMADTPPAPLSAGEDDLDPASPRGFGFEDMFGRRLPIWAGGITLIVAGVLLVKYSIDAGLLSPAVRIMLGLLFGTGLICAAELAWRQADRVRDPRVQQALAGAGIATLYAVILAAAHFYELIGPATAFAGLAGVTALAMALSLRFGAASALLGLVGGMAAPALVDAGQPNVPLLSCYLALAVGGLCALSRKQRWMWLGVGALVGGGAWGALLALSGTLDAAGSISTGFFILALGLGFPLLIFSGNRGAMLHGISAIVAAAQIAALMATGGFAMLDWGLFALLSIGMIWLSLRDGLLRPIAGVGLAVALLLAFAWPHPQASAFAAVMGGIAIIYGGAAFWRLWRADGSLLDAAQIIGVSLGGYIVLFFHFGITDDGSKQGPLALLACVAAVLPLSAAAYGWLIPIRRDDARFASLVTTGMVLLAVAGMLGFADWTSPIVIALAAVALLLFAEKSGDPGLEASGWAFAAVSLVDLLCDQAELQRLGGIAGNASMTEGTLRWLIVAAMAALFAWRARSRSRAGAQAVAALVGYGALAQFIPGYWLPILLAFTLPLLGEAARRLPHNTLLPALATLLTVIMMWAAVPMLDWATAAAMSLFGTPLLASSLALPVDASRRLALPALMIALTLWRVRHVIVAQARLVATIDASIIGAIAAHILFKQVFALSDEADVVHLALAERCLWEALLIALAALVWRFAGRRVAALLLIGAALAHNLIYTLVLHDPLWATQAVGGWPLVNLLLPAFGLPIAALWLGEYIAADHAARFARVSDAIRMMLILIFAFASLRQLFVGTILVVPGLSQGEDIGRSVVAIGLAIGFLLWGIRSGSRDWRIASLVLMLGAVAKVFLLDASGLEGLMRIASFMALGFSLIGIGWLYSRQLRSSPQGGVKASPSP